MFHIKKEVFAYYSAHLEWEVGEKCRSQFKIYQRAITPRKNI